MVLFLIGANEVFFGFCVLLTLVLSLYEIPRVTSPDSGGAGLIVPAIFVAVIWILPATVVTIAGVLTIRRRRKGRMLSLFLFPPFMVLSAIWFYPLVPHLVLVGVYYFVSILFPIYYLNRSQVKVRFGLRTNGSRISEKR